MSHTDMTATEVFESLTGFDEIAIAQKFGTDVTVLADTKPTMFMRALVYVLKRRDGMTDAEAKNAAMGLTLKAAEGYFADDAADPMPEGSPSGKDEPQPDVEPTT